MTFIAEVVKFQQPDCIFCGNWRSTMIRMYDDAGGSVEKFVCVFCANTIARQTEFAKKSQSIISDLDRRIEVAMREIDKALVTQKELPSITLIQMIMGVGSAAYEGEAEQILKEILKRGLIYERRAGWYSEA